MTLNKSRQQNQDNNENPKRFNIGCFFLIVVVVGAGVFAWSFGDWDAGTASFLRVIGIAVFLTGVVLALFTWPSGSD